MLVFTKSVNSNICALWLAPVTRNILGYSQTNTKKATNFGLSVSTGRYKIILMLNLQQNR